MRTSRFSTSLGIAIVALAVLASATTQAAERWILKGGPAPIVRNLRVFSNTPVAGQTTLFAATLGGGVVKLVDNGTQLTPQQLNNGLPSLRIRSVGGTTVLDLYALTEAHGVYHTTDGGANWTPANGSGGTALGCRAGGNMSVRSATEIWVATTCNSASGAWRTTDGGATWARIGTATIPADAIGNSIGFNSANTIIFASANYGLFRSDDNGANWSAINNGLPAQGGAGKLNTFSVAFGATAAEMLTVLDDAGVYKSTDSGANWTVSNSGLPSTNIVAGISRETPTLFYAGVDGYGIYRSIDAGATWSLWGVSNTAASALAARGVVADGAGRRYVNSLEGMLRTTNNGASFTDGVDGFPESSVNSIAVSPDGSKALITASNVVRNDDVYASDWGDAGFTEFGPANGLTGTSSTSAVHYHDTDPNIMYTTLDSTGLYNTFNGGATWTRLVNLPIGATERIRYRSRGGMPAEVWAGLTNPFLTASGGGIHRSTDSGATWGSLGATLTDARSRHINRIALHATDTALVFAATAGGIYRSVDTGGTWSLVYSANDAGGVPIPVGWVVRDAVSPNLVYAAVDYVNPDGSMTPSTGVLRSVDSGTNWTNVLPNRRARQLRLQGDATAFAVLDDEGGQPALMISLDGGTTWNPATRGLGKGSVRSMGQGTYPNYRVRFASMDTGIYMRVNTDSKDMNLDDKGDLLWSNTADGSVQAWLMNGLTATSIAGILPAGGGYTVTQVADINADGRGDLFIRHTDGTIITWIMSGLTVLIQTTLAPAGTGYSVVKTGDFDGDGKSDVLLQHTNGTVQGWLLDGPGVKGTTTFVGAGSGWTAVQVGDFDGDGKADILWQHTDGSVQLWLMNGLSVAGIASLVPAGSGWSAVLTGDFNGDGKTDILWQHTDGRTQAWLMNGLTVTGLASFTPAGTGWVPKLAGDINGDGMDDLFWEHSTNASQTWLMNGINVIGLASFVAAGPWKATHLVDLNGDGKKDVSWRNADGSVQTWLMNGLVVTGVASLAPAGTYLMIP